MVLNYSREFVACEYLDMLYKRARAMSDEELREEIVSYKERCENLENKSFLSRFFYLWFNDTNLERDRSYVCKIVLKERKFRKKHLKT